MSSGAGDEKMRARYLLPVVIVALVSALSARVFAQGEVSPTNAFPNPFGSYYSTNTGFYPVPGGGLVTLEGLSLTSPTGSIPPPLAPAIAFWSGGKTFNAQTYMSFFGGPTLSSFNPGQAAAASIRGTLDAPPLHTYDTEMLTLSLTGLPSGAMIRESPTLPSMG